MRYLTTSVDRRVSSRTLVLSQGKSASWVIYFWRIRIFLNKFFLPMAIQYLWSSWKRTGIFSTRPK